jgi:hypothetical protein
MLLVLTIKENLHLVGEVVLLVDDDLALALGLLLLKFGLDDLLYAELAVGLEGSGWLSLIDGDLLELVESVLSGCLAGLSHFCLPWRLLLHTLRPLLLRYWLLIVKDTALNQLRSLNTEEIRPSYLLVF